MPPLHPVFVHFPIALFAVALGADVFGRMRPSAETRALGYWCLVGAVLGAASAVAAGVLDMYRADLAEATHRFVHLHRDIGIVLLGVLGVLAVWRWRIWRRTGSADRVGWPYLFSAAAVFALVLFQGWFGGQLVYGLGAGVSAAGQGVVSPEEGQMGLTLFSVFTEEAHDHHGHHSR
jgi:uncharacterized membrane protein